MTTPARSRPTAALLLAASLAASWPASSLACGACDEDRIAATYDHAVVERAAAKRQRIVYCALEGRFDGADLKRAVVRLKGVDPGSVRVSAQPGALSFAVDTRVRSATATVEAIRGALPGGASLRVVRTE